MRSTSRTALAFALAITLFQNAAHSADPVAPADPIAFNRQIDEEIRKLQDAPGAKEVFDLQKKINALDTQNNQQRSVLITEMESLQKAEAYKQYEAKSLELEHKRYSEWEVERTKMAAAAKAIYEARHAELAKLAPKDIPGARAMGFDVLTFPRVDGSTSTHPLAIILASRILNVPYAWAYPEPTGNPWERAPVLATAFRYDLGGGWGYRSDEFALAASRAQATGTDESQRRIAAVINNMLAANTETHSAYVNLIEGTCDINLTARGPSADEAKLAAEKKVEIELVPIATDALVFIVHQSNPIKNLSLDQIKEIFALKSANWQTLGGPSKPIRPLLRELNSGSRELFDTLVMKTPTDPAYASATGRLYTSGMGGPYSTLTQQPEAIAYSVYYYEHFMALSPYTRNLAINGVEPTYDTLASGKYPLAAPVFAALRKSDPANSPGRKLAAFLISAEGKQLIKESGYVPTR